MHGFCLGVPAPGFPTQLRPNQQKGTFGGLVPGLRSAEKDHIRVPAAPQKSLPDCARGKRKRETLEESVPVALRTEKNVGRLNAYGRTRHPADEKIR